MKPWRLADLVDLEALQQMAQAHWLSAGIPIGIVDAHDGAVLVGAGWQERCVRFHRANPRALVACQESGLAVSAHLVEGKPFQSRCRHGLWDISLRALFVSGHSSDTLARHAAPGPRFLAKPFTGQALRSKVRQILDEA